MVKKIIALATLVIIITTHSSERMRSSKPYARLGNFLSHSNKPITLDALIQLIKTLEQNTSTDIRQEYTRHIQLAKYYGELCGNLRTRGKKNEFDKFKAHEMRCQKKADELKQEINQQEAPLTDIYLSICAILAEKASNNECYEKIVDFCQNTLSTTDNANVHAACMAEKLVYEKLLALEEMKGTPLIHNNEFIETAYRCAITYANSTNIQDIRNTIKATVEHAHNLAQVEECAATILRYNYAAEENTATESSVRDLDNARMRAKHMVGISIINLKDKLDADIRAHDEKVHHALTNANQTSTAEHLAALANAYHERAEFYQNYYSETCQDLVERGHYDARNAALRAFGKNKAIRSQLKFAL